MEGTVRNDSNGTTIEETLYCPGQETSMEGRGEGATGKGKREGGGGEREGKEGREGGGRSGEKSLLPR